MSELEVTHIYPSRDTPSCEGDYLKGGKIRLFKDIDLEIGTPRQILDQPRGVIDQLLVFGAHLLVNNGNETCVIAVILTGRDGECMCLPSHSARLPYGST